MTNLFLLMLVYITYTVVAFWLFNCNFLSPSFVFSGSIAAMVTLAYYAAVTLGMLFAITLETFTIFAVAGFVFLATEFFVYAFHTADYFRNRHSVMLETPNQPLIIHRQVQWAYTAFLIISLLISLASLYMSTGGGSWNNRIRAFRGMWLANPGAIRFRFILAQLYKINLVTTNFFGYVLVYNVSICKVPLMQLISYIIDVPIFIVYAAITTGARQLSLEAMLFMIMAYMIVNTEPKRKKKLWGFIIKSIPFVIILLSSFSYVGTLVGRYETDKSGFQELSEYFCGGLYSFNMSLDRAASSKIWGLYSFIYLYTIPINLGLIPFSEEFNVINGEFTLYGNTITIFGRWYRDFGHIGVFVMSSIVSLFFSLFFYKKIIYSRNKTKINHVARVLYCQIMSSSLVWAGYDDRIGYLLTVQTIVFIILTKILYRLLIIDKYKLF